MATMKMIKMNRRNDKKKSVGENACLEYTIRISQSQQVLSDPKQKTQNSVSAYRRIVNLINSECHSKSNMRLHNLNAINGPFPPPAFPLSHSLRSSDLVRSALELCALEKKPLIKLLNECKTTEKL